VVIDLPGLAVGDKSSAIEGATNTLNTMLTADQHVILEFERGFWLRPGPKDQSIEFDLGLAAAVYYELLLEILEDPDAYSEDPLTVSRLRAMIDTPFRDARAAG